jgi:hypothetical protein
MLYKFKIMRNSVIVLISAFLLSCEDPTNIGFPSENGDQGQTFFTDTLSLNSSTYLMDTAITSNQAGALVGSFYDPLFGTVTSVSYLQPTLKEATNPATFTQVTSPFTMGATAVYDSLILRLINKDLVLYGDTLPNLTIQIHRLSQPLSSTKGYNYNEEQSYDATPLASMKITINDFTNATKDSLFYIRFKLPEALGKELAALANTESAKVREDFSKAFRGFRISALSGAKTLTAFNLGSVSGGDFSNLTIYYHNQGSTEVDGYQFEFTAGRYNKISTDRAATALASLTKTTTCLNSSKTDGKVYVQAGNGTAAKITFPGLAKLKNPQIGRAELVFSADRDAFSANIPRAPFITLVEINDNQTIKRVKGDYGYINYVMNATSGILSTYVDSTNQFKVDVTPYLQHIISQNRADNGIALVAAIPASNGLSGYAFNAGLNRIVLQNFKLNLYYTEK